MLSNRKGSVVTCFKNRISDVPCFRNRLPVYLAVASGTLRATLDDVTGNCPGREPIPIVGCPTELMDHRPERQARIGASTSNDHLSALTESRGDWSSSEVYVCALHEISNFR